MALRNGELHMENDENLEMDFLRPSSEKRTRFQVNRVRTESCHKYDKESPNRNMEESHSEDDDVHSATDRTRLSSEYAHKSLRHLTREALPRLDNYRNIMSIQAANRPTLDELHNATLPKSEQSSATQNGKPVNVEGQLKFGWIQGVLIRCLLNIWGVMLFLRLSWVVGQAGIGQAVLLILITTAVTSITALSMSAISTNGVIKGGGTYYMISRSLGPEFGGSIGLIFSLANAVACAMYVVGFCESIQDLLSSFGLYIVDKGVNDVRIIGCITIVILTVIVVVGMEWEAKAQLVLLVILIVAIFDFLIGCLVGPGNDGIRAKGFVGFNGTVLWQNMFPDFRESEGVNYEFFKVFAVFFPAATGILAGANISGDLKDPQKSIPKGTLLAILITTMSYIIMAIFAGCTVLRDASGVIADYRNGNLSDCQPNCKFGLHNSFQVIELASLEGSLIYAGCFAATLSSALASLVSAPKVFQALCKDKLYPYIEWFGKGFGPNNEPIRGYILTFVLAVGFLLIGELNLIAPLISNFFLAAYMLINFSTFHASLAKPVGWRPTFKYYNMWLSLAGAILCVLVMFLISWWTALLTFVVILALYLIVSYRKPNVNWGSTTQAQIYKNALNAAQQLNTVEEHVKNYRPQLLVLSGMPSARPALVEFAHLLTKNLSMLICGHVNTVPLSQRVREVLNYKANSWLKAHKIKAFYQQVDGVSFQEGVKALLKTCGIGKLRPNILMMGFKSDWQTCPTEELLNYFEILHNALDLHLGVSILRLQQGLDVNESVSFMEQKGKNSPTPIQRNLSYGQISQGSSGSEQSFNTREKEETVNVVPDEIQSKVAKSMTESAADLASEAQTENENISTSFPFQKTQRRKGNIDVWWLYDDGGLTLLLPYIMSTRRNWSSCKLRVFALANNREGLELEHRNMASLLAKFRIEYSDLQIVPDITKKPNEVTQALFGSLIADFRSRSENVEQEKEGTITITDSELMAVKEKTNRYMRLRELLLEHSYESEMVVITLPIPRKNIVSAATYLAWLELLTKDMPPVLLVRGNQTVHFKRHMLNGAPPGTIGAANPSGWSNEENVLQYMQHFIDHVKPSKDGPVLLLFDNHESHVSLPVINLAKSNGVLLTFPPHISHKIQPLDRTVFGPYKTYYNQALIDWMLRNSGKPITLYQIAEIVGVAYPKAFTQQNIIKGFSLTGICSLNTEIFGEEEFLSSFITDRPEIEQQIGPLENNRTPIDKPGPSHRPDNVVSSQMVRPYPKAAPRKTKGGRKKGRTRILTETPEKLEIETEYLKKQAKKSKSKVQEVKRKVFKKALKMKYQCRILAVAKKIFMRS